MLTTENAPLIAISGNQPITITSKMINRHGLVAGATGTGKTVTLQCLSETFSQMGIPVFAADIKGDLSGVAVAGGNKDSVVQRVQRFKLEGLGFRFQSFPVQFWDVFGEQGVPVRATIEDMGPLLFSRLLALNDTQTAVLTVLFKFAKDNKLHLIDLKDLKKIVEYASSKEGRPDSSYGNLSPASLGAIMRSLIAFEHEGAAYLFGEPALSVPDLLRTEGGKGVINILASSELMNSPKVYSTFLLWLLSKLYDTLPEVGDLDKPKLVFFFDEAHLLFGDASKALVEKIEQIVRLIRSKGVGVYFISQSPSDISDPILAQLGNRVQHALRAYTPKDQKSVKAAAASFRVNPAFDTEEALSALETGEALVSFLDAKGAPMPVERAFILPPQGQIGPISSDTRSKMIGESAMFARYATGIDRESAYEILEKRLNTTNGVTVTASQAKELERQRRAEEKQQAAREREEKREAARNTRFWQGVAKDIVVPMAKKLLSSLFKK